MRATFCLLTLAAVCAAVSGDEKSREASKPPEAGATAEAELKWAKGVATDFFDAYFEGRSFAGLLTSHLYQEYARIRQYAWTTESAFGLDGFSSASITSGVIDPSHSEALFSGVLEGSKKKAEFALRVGKEAGGRWAVRFIKVREQKAAPKERGKPAEISAELKWARGVATDCIEALTTQEIHNFIGLLSPEFARIVTHGDFGIDYPHWWSFKSGAIRSERVAPDRSEVVFAGILKNGSYQGDFVFRVARESGGRWSIRYLKIEKGEAAP
jgi:hypothetical protein